MHGCSSYVGVIGKVRQRAGGRKDLTSSERIAGLNFRKNSNIYQIPKGHQVHFVQHLASSRKVKSGFGISTAN